jgi:hypothetical protein
VVKTKTSLDKSPQSNKNKMMLPYNDLSKARHHKARIFHDRKASNLTLPKMDENDNFSQ